jgi:hypothetical protein
LHHQKIRNPLHANETIAGIGACLIERRATIAGELENPVCGRGRGVNDAVVNALGGGIDRFAADP